MNIYYIRFMFDSGNTSIEKFTAPSDEEAIRFVIQRNEENGNPHALLTLFRNRECKKTDIIHEFIKNTNK